MSSYRSGNRVSLKYEYPGYYLPYYSPVLEHQRQQRRAKLHKDMAISCELTNNMIKRSYEQFGAPQRRKQPIEESIHNESLKRSIQRKSSIKKSINNSFGRDSLQLNPQRNYLSERKHSQELKRSRQLHRTTY